MLPEGYKDLILSFVENQLKDGDTFDDVINGKGKHPCPASPPAGSRPRINLVFEPQVAVSSYCSRENPV